MRRSVVAGLLAAAVGLTVFVLAPPPPATQDVAVLRADVRAGTPIGEEDVEVRALPAEFLPPEHIASAEAAVGLVARVGIPRGTPLSSPLVLGPGVADDAPPGHAVLAVELARQADVMLAEPGRTVTLVGRDPRTGEPRSLGSVLVLGVVKNDDISPFVGSATTGAETAVAYVAVPDGDAILLGDSVASAPVSVVLSP